MSHATFVVFRNAFRPSQDRDVSAIAPGRSIVSELRERELVIGRKTKDGRYRLKTPFVVQVNGKVSRMSDWAKRINGKDVVTVSYLPRGGGGSNPLQILAMVALVVISFFFPPAIGLTGMTALAATAGIMIGGALALSMMFKQKSPSGNNFTNESASPTYTINSRGNTARLLEAIPVWYGRNRGIPDYASQPFQEYIGNEQYIYFLYCISQGIVDVEKITIGDNDISSFPDTEYQLILPGQKLTLFPGNVISSTSVNNNEMLGGNVTPTPIVGPYFTSPANTTTYQLAVDVTLPNGLIGFGDSGEIPASVGYIFQYRQVDLNTGAPAGDWVTFVDNTLTLQTNTPQRITHAVAVPEGRYQVQGYRTSPSATDTRSSSSLYWSVLKGYVPDDGDYGNVTMLAVKMKGNQVTQENSGDLAVIGTRKIPTWNAIDGWSAPIANRSIAWAAADMLRNTVYGRSLPSSRYALETLAQLDQTFTARGDTFNFIFDTSTTLWDALTKCLGAGRTTPIYYAGLIDFVRDQPQTLPVGMFQPSNISKGSFSTSYLFAEIDTPDHVVVNIVNEDTWQNDQVKCVLPPADPDRVTKPQTIDMPGVTNRAQAWREGILLAARNKHQRRAINITTELDGLMLRYNDLCQISHDVPEWGYSGRILSIDTSTGFIETTEKLPFVDETVTHVIAFRKKNGGMDGPHTIRKSPDTEYGGFVQGDISNVWISDGNRVDFTEYQFGPTGKAGLEVVAMSAKPDNSGKVALAFANYAPEIYVYESGGVPPDPTSPSNLPKPPVLPIVDKVTLEYTFEPGHQKLVATPATGALTYEFAASPDGGVTWIPQGISADYFVDVYLSPGEWIIRARGIGQRTGPWATATYQVEGSTLPTVALTVFQTSEELFAIRTNWAIDPLDTQMAKEIEIYISTTNNKANASLLAKLPWPISTYLVTDLNPGDTRYFWARMIDIAGRAGPWWNNNLPVVGQASSDVSKILDALGGEISESMLSEQLRTKIDTTAAQSAENAQNISTLAIQQGDTSAAVQEISTVVSDQSGQLAAMKTIRTQISTGGLTYYAGIAIGVEQQGGVIESRVLVAADTFAVIDPTSGASLVNVPFAVVGGVAYLRAAFIQDGTITNAKISGAITSNLINATLGVPVWTLDKAGTFSFYPQSGYGGLRIDSQAIKIYDDSNVKRVQLGNLNA